MGINLGAPPMTTNLIDDSPKAMLAGIHEAIRRLRRKISIIGIFFIVSFYVGLYVAYRYILASYQP
jgi:hypothetical protein